MGKLKVKIMQFLVLLAMVSAVLNTSTAAYCSSGDDISITTSVQWDQQDKIIINGVIKATTSPGVYVKLKNITYTLTVKENNNVLYTDSATEDDNSLLDPGEELTRFHVFSNINIQNITENTIANGEINVSYKLADKAQEIL